jgi:transcriptional regulator
MNAAVITGSEGRTVRQRITERLTEDPLGARELSQELRISEREVYAHLPHVAQSATSKGARLRVLPFSCLSCGFDFRERRRFNAPGRCPRCRSTHLEQPKFTIEG